jgi:hypothetical protein
MDKLGLGRKMEQEVMVKWMQDEYETWQPPRAKWSSQDIFELFDFVAIRPWYPVEFVQVKRYRAKELETARAAISAFADAYHAPIRCFLVYWRRNAFKRICFVAEEYGLTGWEVSAEWAVDA